MEATVRLGRPEDAPEIAVLMGQLGYPVPPAQIEDRLGRMPEHRVVLVAEVDAAIVGWTSVCADETLVDGLEACIEGFVVAEHARSHGLGLRLLHEAERWAKARGCANLIVRSNVVRTRAHTFYERNGYLTIKSQRFLRKPL